MTQWTDVGCVVDISSVTSLALDPKDSLVRETPRASRVVADQMLEPYGELARNWHSVAGLSQRFVGVQRRVYVWCVSRLATKAVAGRIEAGSCMPGPLDQAGQSP
jgi:hypothetical protein